MEKAHNFELNKKMLRKHFWNTVSVEITINSYLFVIIVRKKSVKWMRELCITV